MIGIILGTRPEIIKFSPIIRACIKNKKEFFIIHTGQHYSFDMDKIFFQQLELPSPEYNLNIGSQSHGKQTGQMIIGIEEILAKVNPEIILVQGDTNSVLAGAVAASKMHILLGHVEAGLRSFDRKMPEEINRILTDHCSDFLFAPTRQSRDLLLHEGIPKKKIFITGNTVIDAIKQNLKISEKRVNVLDSHKLVRGKYILATVHRQENVDDKHRFESILNGLENVQEKFSLPVIYPIHPRAKKMLEEYHMHPKKITIVAPQDYLSFLQLERYAKLILTDSGGVQEEACALKVPCVTLRDTTERPETLKIGANLLVGAVPEKIVNGATKMLKKNNDWINPFGDGRSGMKILKILENVL